MISPGEFNFSLDLLPILAIALLESLLSIDNALVLALLAHELPPDKQRKALTYGLAGAVVFRLVAIWLITSLLKWSWIKFVGAAYLLWICGRHFVGRKRRETSEPSSKSFWTVVLAIELTDIAFAIDSIVAAVALSDKFWVIFAGGLLGVLTMRGTSGVFVKLLRKFPRLEAASYWIVGLVGFKLFLEACRFPGIDFHAPHNPSFWFFWGMLALCLGLGLR